MALGGLPLLLVLALMWGPLAAQEGQGFDHQKHSKVFASCTACHVGAAVAGASMWPSPVSCGACHDGTIQKRVTWQAPREAMPTNLRFDHVEHSTSMRDKVVTCTACHAAQGAPWMTAEAPKAERCLECHGVRTAHLAAPDTACATCHLPLVRAERLTVKDVAAFPKPPSHEQPNYAGAESHGRASQAKGANCATCHARDFCLQCHVDAPERPSIQALAPDPRSLGITATPRPPTSHQDPAFVMGHGTSAKTAPEQCAVCHTRESCLTCHSATTRVAARLPAAGPSRGTGAVITRRRPPSHGANYAERHAAAASTTAATCAGCHARSDCLECHRPDAARAAGYHPRGFLARHPAAAYSRQTNCSDCHNTAGFCATCHASAGLVSRGGQLRAGYHDFNVFFSAGHGQAARQSLETCVGCHVEKDCLTCHSARGGRHINPHGPGFDPAREIKKNPQMCTACHGTDIPTQ